MNSNGELTIVMCLITVLLYLQGTEDRALTHGLR